MPTFHYTAITRAGLMVQGLMDAPSETAVVEHLQCRGCVPVGARLSKKAPLVALLRRDLSGGQSLRRQEVAKFTRELAIMLAAGQSLDHALRFAVETAAVARVRTVLDQLREAVRDGSSLAAALGRHPRSFSQLYVGLIRAGEAGAQLAPTLEQLATLLERQQSLSATITSALIYPSLVLVAAVASITMMLTEILPKYVSLFLENGANLPASTQLLIDVGALVSSYGLHGMAGLVALVLVARAVLQRPAPRLLWDRAILWLPVIGELWREILAARFTRTFGTLLTNGVPLIAALDVVRDVVGNQAAVQAVQKAALSAKGGNSLAEALGAAAIFPAQTIHLLRLGEQNAKLAQLTLRAADIHEEKTRIGLQRLVALMVPAITIVLGSIVGWVVSSLMLAMLSLNDLVQ